VTVPIKSFASKLELPVHQIDAFEELKDSEWQRNINLIVAVSFGLLIPAKLIESAKYGGLNLHPSLLPEYVLFLL
jgi:methionyl-tRNA formyltransferase